MRSPSLTRRPTRLPDGRLASAYEHNGERIWVCDSALDALRILQLARNQALSEAEKSERIIKAAFADPTAVISREEGEAQAIVSDILWEAFGLDVTADHAHAAECDEAVFDFDEDAARIRASLLAYYGLDWDEAAESITYADLCALLAQMSEADHQATSGGLPSFRTSFAQALWYRTAKPPKNDKLNRGLRKAFLATRESLRLGAKKRTRIEAANDAMAETMAAARRGV